MSSSVPSTSMRPPIEPGYFLTPRRGAAAAAAATSASSSSSSKTEVSPLIARRKRASTSYGPTSSSSAALASTPLQPRPAPRRRQGSSAGSSQDHQHQRLAAPAPTPSGEAILSSSFGHDFGLARRPTAPAHLVATDKTSSSSASSSSAALSPPPPAWMTTLLHRSQSEMTLRNKPTTTQPPQVGGDDDQERRQSGTESLSGRRRSRSGDRTTTPPPTMAARDGDDMDALTTRPRSSASSSSCPPPSSPSSRHDHMTGNETDVLETASEGRSSAWATRLGHSKESSVATMSTMTAPGLAQRDSLQHERSESGDVVEELQDHHDHHEKMENGHGYGHGYHGSTDSTPPSLSSSSYDTSDQASSSRVAFEGHVESYSANAAGASWGAKFWVVIEDPKTSNLFFYNPSTKECRWTVSAGTFVLPRDPEGDWLEFWDSNVGLPYYWHTASKKTQWEYPEGARLVLPLTAIQTGDTTTTATATTSSSSSGTPSINPPATVANHSRRPKTTAIVTRHSSIVRAEARPSMPLSASTSSSTMLAPAMFRAQSLNDIKKAQLQQTDAMAARGRARGSSEVQTPATIKMNGVASHDYAAAGMASVDSGVALADEAARGGREVRGGRSSVGNGAEKRRRPQSQTEDLTSTGSSQTIVIPQAPLRRISEQASPPVNGEAPGSEHKQGPPPPASPHTVTTSRAVSSLLGIPQPPTEHHAHNRALSNDLTTLSSVSVRGPVRRHRDPEKRARDSHLRARQDLPPILTKTMSPQTAAADIAVLPRQRIDPKSTAAAAGSGATPSSSSTSSPLHAFATTHFAPRRRTFLPFLPFFHHPTPLAPLKWHKGKLDTPVLPLAGNKDLHGDAALCAKVILRVCGERERPVFHGRPPPVAIGYVPPSTNGHGHGGGGGGGAVSSSPTTGTRLRCAERKKQQAQQRLREILGRGGDHHTTSATGTSSSSSAGAGAGAATATTTIWQEQRWLIETCICKPSLRDEVFCQLLSRLGSTAPPTTRQRAWQFLGVLLASIAPTSVDLAESLDAFIAETCVGAGASANGDDEDDAASTSAARITAIARHCQRRLDSILRRGTSPLSPSLAEVTAQWEAAFHPVVFGQTLPVIMAAQCRAYPTMAIPVLLPFLGDALLNLGATAVRGVWRLSGDVGQVVALRLRIDRGEYSLQGVDGWRRESRGKEERERLALVVAGVLKLFLRELAEPLVPYALYGQCIKAAAAAAVAMAARPTSMGGGASPSASSPSHSNSGSAAATTTAAATAACLSLVSPDNEAQMPALNRRCLLYLVALLQCFLEPAAVKATGVDARTLASLLSPALLRPPPWAAAAEVATVDGEETQQQQQSPRRVDGSVGGGNANAKWESIFVYQLLVAWDVERVDPEFVPRLTTPTAGGAEGRQARREM